MNTTINGKEFPKHKSLGGGGGEQSSYLLKFRADKAPASDNIDIFQVDFLRGGHKYIMIC